MDPLLSRTQRPAGTRNRRGYGTFAALSPADRRSLQKSRTQLVLTWNRQGGAARARLRSECWSSSEAGTSSRGCVTVALARRCVCRWPGTASLTGDPTLCSPQEGRAMPSRPTAVPARRPERSSRGRVCQAMLASGCFRLSACWMARVVSCSAGIGRASRKPWPWSQPLAVRSSQAALVSIPSPTVVMPRV